MTFDLNEKTRELIVTHSDTNRKERFKLPDNLWRVMYLLFSHIEEIDSQLLDLDSTDEVSTILKYYDSIDSFPEEGEEETLYIDTTNGNVYIYTTEYVKLNGFDLILCSLVSE